MYLKDFFLSDHGNVEYIQGINIHEVHNVL